MSFMHFMPSQAFNLGDVGFIRDTPLQMPTSSKSPSKEKSGHGSRPHMTKDPLVAAAYWRMCIGTPNDCS